ncbi:hypothetical protein [Bacillus sp. 2205SS5-2]|uniref:hypothetical protein n=1 Tax=Bacillus sp. 2205SS5-2 TaxID=3109031 RepID=UPI003005DFC6
MKSVIVFAAQKFLGFELCKYLVEKGYSVHGLDEDIEENRWLEIGRNANATYSPYSGVLDKNQPEHIVFSFYDCDSVQIKLLSQQLKDVSTIRGVHFHCLFPTHLLSERFEVEWLQLNRTLQDLKTENKVSTIYLPTIFGPKQPEKYLYAYLMRADKADIKKKLFFDDPSDVLWIEDVIKAIEANFETECNCLYASFEEGRWEKGLKMLSTEAIASDTPLFIRSHIEEKVQIKQSIALQKGLELQRQSYKNDKK